ncbi:MAG: helix-turn-helix domain-containing protein, partial [Pseudomonadota bacterium]
LLYRLNTIEIDLPPLRERRDDIVALALHYLRAYERKYSRPVKPLPDPVAATLRADPWPGNVRALRHAAERAVILNTGDAYGVEDFAVASPAGGEPMLRASSAEHKPPQLPQAGPDSLNLEQAERQLIERALRRHQFNIALAARELGLSRGALYRRMEKHGL